MPTKLSTAHSSWTAFASTLATTFGLLLMASCGSTPMDVPPEADGQPAGSPDGGAHADPYDGGGAAIDDAGGDAGRGPRFGHLALPPAALTAPVPPPPPATAVTPDLMTTEDCASSLSSGPGIVYIGGCSQAQVRRMAPGVGSAKTLASTECIGPMVVDGGHAYYSAAGANCSGPFELYRVALDFSTPAERLATIRCSVQQMAVDARGLFWLDECGELLSLPREGGEPVALLSELDCATGPQIRGDQLYVVDTCQGSLYTVSLSGEDTTRSAFQTDGCRPGGPATLAGDRIAWVDECERRIRRLPIGGGSVESAGDCVADLKTIDGQLHYSRYCSPGLFRLSSEDASSKTVLSLEHGPDQFTADSSHLYWTTGGQIWRQRR